MAHTYRGSPGTWEVLSSPSWEQVGHLKLTESRPAAERSLAEKGAKKRARGGNPKRRQRSAGDGRQEIGALHSTCEAGEPTRGTLWREGGAGLRTRWRERCRERRIP